MKLKLLPICLMLLAGITAVAQDAKTANGSQTPDKGLTPDAQLLTMANDLVKYGYQTETALPLIQALEIYNRLGLSAQDMEKTSTGSAALPEKDVKSAGVSYDRNEIIAAATRFADGNKETLALLNDVKAQRSKIGQSIYHTDRVRAGYTDVYKYRFRGGEDALVIVSGDGDTDLDLYIYDENGNLIDSDTDYTDDCVCTWTPRWTGEFTIKIKNRGNVYNEYVLAIPGDY